MDGNAQKETCRAPAPGPDGFVPARPRVVLALAVLVLAGMAGFCLALYHSLTAVRPVDPADYPGAAPEGFRWEAAVSREDGRAVFTGWACVEGEPFPDVDIRAADRRAMHPDQHILRPRLRDRGVDQFKADAGRGLGQGFHRVGHSLNSLKSRLRVHPETRG